MDPLKVFSEITCEKILSYLPVKDLLNCFLINKSYYNFIANSTSCMNRIKLQLYHKHGQFPDELCKSLNFKKSKRKYRHIECFNLSIDVVNNYILHQQFKSIKIKRVLLCDEGEYETFFQGISSSIEELILERFYQINPGMPDTSNLNISYPKLRHLELHYMPHCFYQTVSNCTNLRVLRITGKRDGEFYKILRQNPQLKKLSIVSCEIDNYFEEDISKFIEFKLTHFEVRDIYNLTRRCIENFKNLLENQMSSLEEIDLGDWIAADIVKLIFHMPRLKTLTFKGFHNIEEHVNMSEMNFNRSSITTLNLLDVFCKFDILQAFVRACPHVQHLRLYSLKQNSLFFLTEALPNLKTLSLDLLEIDSLNNECDFVHLNEFSMKVYRNHLQISESTSNNFEKLVKKEINNLIKEGNRATFL